MHLRDSPCSSSNDTMQSPSKCSGVVQHTGMLRTTARSLPSLTRMVMLLCLSVTSAIIFSTNASAQQRYGSIKGLVTDVLDGQVLKGATVFLTQPGNASIVYGTTTDWEGGYEFQQVLPGRYTMFVRYVGYEEERMSIDIAPNQRHTLDASLEQSRIDLNTIVVSASRYEEKVLDAITSVSVMSDHEIQKETLPSPASSLRLVTGVDHAQTGIDRREISLRGFNNSVTGETYVLTDNRLSAIPGLALNAYGLMPIPTLDVSRVEIVRGPGSALYGSGVDQGLIHFITKDPFTYPGTSVSVGGGERGLLETEFRYAGVSNESLGYKIIGEFASGEDWELSRSDPEDISIIAAEGDTLRDPDYWKYGINGWLEYRFNENTRFILNGGFLSQKMTILTGIGAAQTDNFSYLYGQAQLYSGPFYAQIYLNKNNGGNSYYYGPTTLSGSTFSIVDHTMLVNGQMQYTNSFFNGREDLLIGADFKLTLPETESTIHGRNESDDRIQEAGLYVQSTTRLTEDVSLTVAGRGDYNNIANALQLSPRAGIVFKITPLHTFSVSANLAYSAPVLNPNFLDRRISDEIISGPYSFASQGLGARNGFTFNQYREQGNITFLLPDLGDLQQSTAPSFFGQSLPLERLPIHPLYESFASQMTEALLNGGTLPEPLGQLTLTDRETFARLVNQLLPFVQGNTAGTLGIPANNEQGYLEIMNPADIAPLEQTRTSTFEVGYKGTISDRIVLSTDVYVTQKQNFIGPLSLASPFVYAANLEQDLDNLLTPLIGDFAEADPELASLLQDLGLSASEASALLSNIASAGFEEIPAYAESRIGVVQPDQQVLPDGSGSTVVGGLYTYRNFGNVTLWGTDVAVDYFHNDQLSVHGTLSFVSDGYFDNTELQEEGNELAVALNAPTLKMGLGAEYQFPFGLSLKANVRTVNDFTVISGPYQGEVDGYTVIDSGIGYDFGRQITGLRFDLTAQNLVTFVDGSMVKTHREFIGAPQVGRIVMARILFTF